MDFEDTKEEAAFRAKCRAWLDDNAEPLGSASEKVRVTRNPEVVKRAKAWQAKKADAGWACVSWPKEYGGQAFTRVQNTIWNQEEARYNVPPGIFSIGQGMLGPTLMTHGTTAQKERHLKPMLRGDEIWCQLFSEPGAGSDLAGLRTTAVRDGDDWVVNGQKIWTTGAQYSKWGMIVTRTDRTALKHKGISYFIIDMESPGIEIRPIKQINGGSSFNEVFFTDVRIPHDNMVGRENEGWRGAITTLMNERASIGGGAAGAVGLSDLIALAKRTMFDGKPAIEDASVRRKLADFYVRSKGLQYTSMRTLTALSKGETPGPESSIGKLVGGPLRQEMARFGMDLQGMAGTMDGPLAADGGAWQQAYLASPGMRIAGGTDEILRNIIAERVLGMPAEARVDKEVPFNEIPTGSRG